MGKLFEATGLKEGVIPIGEMRGAIFALSISGEEAGLFRAARSEAYEFHRELLGGVVRYSSKAGKLLKQFKHTTVSFHRAEATVLMRGFAVV